MKENSKNFNFAMLTYFIIVALFVGLRIISAFGLFDGMGTAANWVFTLIVQVVVLFGGSVLLFSAFKKQKIKTTFEYYGCKKISGKVVWLAVLLGAVVFFLNIFVSSTFNSIIDFLGYEHTTSSIPSSYNFISLVANLMFSALLPGICEELVHRGMLLKSMKPLGMWKSILLSGLFFGLLHLNIEQFFYATIIGIFLGFLTTMTNSIYPAMIVHFMNNALSSYLTFSRVNNLPFGSAYEWFFGVVSSNVLLGILLCLLVLIVLVYLLYILCRKIFRTQLKSEFDRAAEQVQRELTKQAYLIDLENSKNGQAGQEIELADPRLEIIKKLFELKPTQTEKFTPSKYGRLLLWVSFALLSVLTVCTFVWGVL